MMMGTIAFWSNVLPSEGTTQALWRRCFVICFVVCLICLEIWWCCPTRNDLPLIGFANLAKHANKHADKNALRAKANLKSKFLLKSFFYTAPFLIACWHLKAGNAFGRLCTFKLIATHSCFSQKCSFSSTWPHRSHLFAHRWNLRRWRSLGSYPLGRRSAWACSPHELFGAKSERIITWA